MDSPRENQKKYFCARCFLPIDGEEKVDIEGQNFHRICSMCCKWNFFIFIFYCLKSPNQTIFAFCCVAFQLLVT